MRNYPYNQEQNRNSVDGPCRPMAARSRKGKCQMACKPGSVPLRVMTIHLGRTLPPASCNQPGRQPGNRPAGEPDASSLFGLAPGGVCPAAPVTSRAVRSYRTLSPLPVAANRHRRFTFCGTFPGVAPAGHYPAPYFHGARTFLHRLAATAAIQPSDPFEVKLARAERNGESAPQQN
jgi:hypothetical protein